MAKSEILMWVAGIMMMIILGLAVAPTIGKSGDTARIAVINSEIATIRNSSALWFSQNSTDGTLTGLTVAGLSTYLPSLTVTSGKFESKTNTAITYAVTSVNSTQIQITVSGLTVVSGSEASVKTSQTANAVLITDTVITDGTLVLNYNL